MTGPAPALAERMGTEKPVILEAGSRMRRAMLATVQLVLHLAGVHPVALHEHLHNRFGK